MFILHTCTFFVSLHAPLLSSAVFSQMCSIFTVCVCAHLCRYSCLQCWVKAGHRCLVFPEEWWRIHQAPVTMMHSAGRHRGEVGGRVMRRWGIPIRGLNKEPWNAWSLFRGFRFRIQRMQMDSRRGKPLPLLDAQCCGSSPHLLRQTGAGSSEVLHVRLGAALSFIQDEVCGHFALQTGDVAVAEVVTQVVHLWKQIHICQSLHHLLNQCCNLSLTAFFSLRGYQMRMKLKTSATTHLF